MTEDVTEMVGLLEYEEVASTVTELESEALKEAVWPWEDMGDRVEVKVAAPEAEKLAVAEGERVDVGTGVTVKVNAATLSVAI